MWGTVIAIALIAALDPMRLGIAFVLMSQPRPIQSLTAYWLGAMVAAVASALALLTLLRGLMPRLTERVVAVTGSAATGYVQIAIGLLALPMAVLVAKGVFPRQRALQLAGGPAGLAEHPTAPAALGRLTAGVHDGRRGRAFWLAVVAGVVSATPPVEYLVVLAAIMGSEAATGTQFSAALVFFFVALAAVEIPLIGCLIRPERGEALMLALHGWVRVHTRPILAVAFGVGGLLLLASGVNSF